MRTPRQFLFALHSLRHRSCIWHHPCEYVIVQHKVVIQRSGRMQKCKCDSDSTRPIMNQADHPRGLIRIIERRHDQEPEEAQRFPLRPVKFQPDRT